MPLLPGLGTFAESFLNTYKTMHGMDVEDKALEYKRALAEEEARKRALEERRIEAELAAKAAERAAGLEIAQGLRGIPSHEAPEALHRIIIGSKDPNAAAAAAKLYQGGVGGVLPPEFREKQRLRAEMGAILEMHANDPTGVSAEAVGRAAVRRGIPITDLVGMVSDLTTKDDILKAFYTERNKLPAQAGGIQGAPGAVALPGRPVPVAPSGGQTAGDITAIQAGSVAGVEAGAREIGRAKAFELKIPEWGDQRIGEALAKQEGRIAVARETPTDIALKNIDKQLKQAEIDLKRAALEADPGKRANTASQTAQQLMMSEWIVASIQDPAVKERYKTLLEQARELARRGSLPGRAPGVKPKVLGIERIE